MRYILVLIIAFLAAACSTTGKPVDQSKLQQAEQTAELIYSGAKIAVSVFCATSSNVPPCNSPAAMAEVAKAEATLDAAFASARKTLATASSDEQMGTILVGLQEAALLYAKVWAAYGVNRGGG